MAPRKRKPQATQEVAFTPTKVSKRKTGAKPSTTASASTNESPARYRIKRYKNRLLNLEETPPHLVPIVQRNSTESALLRLPPEIRALIWRATLGDQLVVLPENHRKGRGGAVRYTQDSKVDIIPFHLNRIMYDRQVQRLPAAFHLPEVCRQIYSETALTAYTHSTFTFGTEYLNCYNGLTRLRAVQRRSVSSIEPQFTALESCLMDGECYILKIPWTLFKPFKQTFFPNLKTIVIGKLALKFVQLHVDSGPGANSSEEDWKQWITQALKRREGDSIQVVFKDPDPSWYEGGVSEVTSPCLCGRSAPSI